MEKVCSQGEKPNLYPFRFGFLHATEGLGCVHHGMLPLALPFARCALYNSPGFYIHGET